MWGPTSSVNDKVLGKFNTVGPRSGYSWAQENTKEIVIRPWDCDFHHLHITAGLRVNQSVFAHQPLPRNSCVHTHTRHLSFSLFQLPGVYWELKGYKHVTTDSSLTTHGMVRVTNLCGLNEIPVTMAMDLSLGHFSHLFQTVNNNL